MTWFREHLPALAIATGAAIALGGSVYVLEVAPRLPLQFDTAIVEPGEPIDMQGLRLTNISLTARDDEGLLPENTQLYALDVDYTPVPEFDATTCIAPTLVEVDGQQRTFEAFQDWETVRALGDFLTVCVTSFDGAPGTARINFVLPEDHGKLKLILGTPLSDRVQVSISD